MESHINSASPVQCHAQIKATTQMNPFFSIITPVLNGFHDAERYVACLKSQTYENWEAIIIDDGSSDRSVELLRQLTCEDSRFRLIINEQKTKPIAGPYQARNIGLANAKGQYICFLDIDDWWYTRKLANQKEKLEAEPQVKLLYSAYLRTPRGSNNAKIRHQRFPQIALKLICVANPVPMLTSCVSRQTVSDVNFAPLHHEDYIFWRAIIEKLKKNEIAYDPRPQSVYCVDSHSLSGNKLRGITWIWKCYRAMGYNKAQALVALIARGFLQLWIAAEDNL